jgi:hypothetical protein
MSKVTENILVHVKTQGAMGEITFFLLKVEDTKDVRPTLDDMEYSDWKILDLKLIKVDISNCVSYPFSYQPFEDNH